MSACTGGTWGRIGLVAWASLATMSGAMAFDAKSLPQTCQDTLAQMQSEKARFGELGKVMTQARKASDTDNFCKAAREIVVLIKAQAGRLDYCIGDLAGAKDVIEAASSQMIQLKAVYRQMLDSAKDTKNDRFHCGLADQ